MEEFEVKDNGNGKYEVKHWNTNYAAGCSSAVIGIAVLAVIIVIFCLITSPITMLVATKTISEAGLSSAEIMARDSGWVDLLSVTPDGTTVTFGQPSNTWDATDINGDTHNNCYYLHCSEFDEYYAYNIGRGFSTLSADLYAAEEDCVCWIEVYGNNSLLYSSPKLSENNASCSFTINVENIETIIIYPKTDNGYKGGSIITEGFILSK